MTKRRPYAARVPIEVRREQLLDAAIRVIVRDGYDGISVEAIAREAGVTRPVVYGAFDGLGQLLGALLDRQQARALEQLAAAFPSDAADPGAGAARGGPRDGRAGPSDPLTWRPILAAPQATPDAVRVRIDADRELVRATCGAARGRAAPAGVDVELAAHALVGDAGVLRPRCWSRTPTGSSPTAGRVRRRHLAAGAADPRLASTQGECGRGHRSLPGRARGQRPDRYRIARRLDLPPPLFLVVVGVGASYLPGMPEVRLEPEVVLLGLLPPLLYAAAISTSLVDFNRNRRPILLLSVGLVVFTTAGVALLVHALLPGVGWPAAFAIGAVVAPPDAVAATAIGRRIGLPRRIVTILEGESLLNDATALVALRTAIAAGAAGAAMATSDSSRSALGLRPRRGWRRTGGAGRRSSWWPGCAST